MHSSILTPFHEQDAVSVEVAMGMGTSFSVLHVAGVVALGLSIDLQITESNVDGITQPYEPEEGGYCNASNACGEGILDARRLFSLSTRNGTFNTSNGNWTGNMTVRVQSIGLYWNGVNSVPCPVGTYNAGNAYCAFCPPGLSAPAGSSACLPVYPLTSGLEVDGYNIRKITPAGSVAMYTTASTSPKLALSSDNTFVIYTPGAYIVRVNIASFVTVIAGGALGMIDSDVGGSARFVTPRVCLSDASL